MIKETNWVHPVEAFKAFASMPFAHLFHSGDKNWGEQNWGKKSGNNKDEQGRLHALSSRQLPAQWSFIVANPVARITIEEGRIYTDGVYNKGALDEVLRSNLCASAQVSDIPFLSGLAGFIGYETAKHFEPSLEMPPSPYALPDMALGRYEAVIAFDRLQERSFICGLTADAVDELHEIYKNNESCVESRIIKNERFKASFQSVSSNFNRLDYIKAVTKAQEAILNGDYFQTNLSRRILIDYIETNDEHYNHIDMFASIMENSDATYGACLQFAQGVVLSNSPEKFFSLHPIKNEGFKLVAEPIKGTVKRGNDLAEDKNLGQALKNNAKDRAENIMIADLLRNDMSRVCEYDSIKEEEICGLLSLTHVHHLVSRISGKLGAHQDSIDVLRALFPCGSITGAPKIEAMKAIANIEKTGRGPYCGAIGYIDDRGNADFSVAIRVMMKTPAEKEYQISVPVGGGVTLRSCAKEEYEETSLKATALMSMLDIPSDIYS